MTSRDTILDRINGIRRYLVAECAPDPMIYVETFFPAASMMLAMALDQFSPMAIMRSAAGKAPLDEFAPLFQGLRPTGAGGRGRRGCRVFANSGPVKLIKPEFQATGTDKITRALFKIDRGLFGTFFWYSIGDMFVTGLYNWLSLAHKYAGCDPDPIDGPFVHDQIEDAAFHDTPFRALYHNTPPAGPWESPRHILMERGHHYGYISTMGFEPSPFAVPKSFETWISITPVGTSETIRIIGYDVDLGLDPNQFATVGTRWTVSPLGLDFIMETWARVQCDPPSIGNWVFTRGGKRAAWRA